MKTSGILLHISSLPNPYGIGSIGQSAYDFIDFLKKSNQKVWQVLPIGPTSYGDSPYQTLSTFAGNPYFIDLEFLYQDGLLSLKDLKDHKVKDLKQVDYHRMYLQRIDLLRLAYAQFDKTHKPYQTFIEEEATWLNEYALYMTIKETMNGRGWYEWDEAFRRKDKSTLRKFTNTHRNELEFWYFVQYKFFFQWRQLHEYAKKNKIKIMGDIPIYVAYDSSDVWMNPQFYQLDASLVPTQVAGVPPDAFSEDGQRWGNPLYQYEVMEKDHFSWWRHRMTHALQLFDAIRIDHFRGFEAYYAIAYKETTAKQGYWVKGPGMNLWSQILKDHVDAPIIAENLGFLTPEVDDLLKKCQFPGMKVLQFTLLSHRAEDNIDSWNKNLVIYPGTHDNPPLKLWIVSLSRADKQMLFQKLGVLTTEEAIDKIIDLSFNSKAQMVIVTMQDYLHLGEGSRMNTPGTTEGNWTWRLQKRSLTETLVEKIAKRSQLAKR
ncbi:MAG: 4-alpha-glucanotransferase [Bacilli bacterium]